MLVARYLINGVVRHYDWSNVTMYNENIKSNNFVGVYS